MVFSNQLQLGIAIFMLAPECGFICALSHIASAL